MAFCQVCARRALFSLVPIGDIVKRFHQENRGMFQDLNTYACAVFAKEARSFHLRLVPMDGNGPEFLEVPRAHLDAPLRVGEHHHAAAVLLHTLTLQGGGHTYRSAAGTGTIDNTQKS